MPNPRSFSEIFEEIHEQTHSQDDTYSLNAGWETSLEPAGLSQLIGTLTPLRYSRTHIYRYPRAPRPSRLFNTEEQSAFESLNALLEIPLVSGFYRAELKSAYRQALLKTHPDQGGTAESFQQVRKSYEILVRFVK